MKKTILFIMVLSLLLPAAQLLGEGKTEAAEEELTKVTFRMNWKFTGPHAVYLLGKEMGFYEEEGIDVEIMEGNSSVTTG
jgi:NitT/TauT family transport system substrate-binding protein